MSDSTPGVLYRLTVIHPDMPTGTPKLFDDLGTMQKSVAYYERAGLKVVKEACTRTPWLSLDGPVAPEPEVIDVLEA